jgi:DNA-binding transcriptional ArsR family regulator
VSAIGDHLNQSQPAVSHHLTQLRSAGLIDYRRDGKFNYYRLDEAGLAGLFDGFFPDGGTGKLALGGIEIGVRKK